MNKFKHSNAVQAVLILQLLILGASVTQAQIAPNNSYSQMLNTTMVASQSLFNAQMAVNHQRAEMAQAGGQSGHATTVRQPPMKQYPITATDFQALSAPFMPDQFANAATGVTPETRQQMRSLFAQVLMSFESKARKDNLANAFAFISAAALQVRNGKEPTSAQVDQMIVYFNNALAASPQYYTLNPRQQQMLYESLIINGGIIVFLDTQGKQTGDMKVRAKAKEMSDAVLKSFLGI